MHVITWNVNRRSVDCLNGIGDLDLDIVLLQEVPIGGADAFQSRLLRNGLSYWSYSGTLAQDRKRYGNVIASKWQISEPFCEWPDSMPWPHLAHRTTIHSLEGDLDVINVHVPNGSQNGWDKIETLEGIANVIRNAPDDPRILAGDFNEPILIRPNGEIITSGQQIAADGSVRLGRRSRGKAGPGQFTDPQGRTDDLQRWDQGVRDIFEARERLRLCHVRHLMPGHPHMPVTHRTLSNARFFDHVFLSRHFRVSEVEYLHHVRDSGYSPFGSICRDPP